MSNSDLTFITNENGRSLLNRFQALIKDTWQFDVLVGYFYTSGFYQLIEELEKTEKIRILIGIDTDKSTVQAVKEATQNTKSDYELRQNVNENTREELEIADDTHDTERGVSKLVEWLRNGKVEIKAYPSSTIHAKLYIMKFKETDRDLGRVITGSSNFTRSGLSDNLEFNVELKQASDYQYAQDKFNNLWKDAVDVKDVYLESIQKHSWFNDEITPHELYMKFLYEYFKDQISKQGEVILENLPAKYRKLEYQEQAVLNAKNIVEEYGGVFLSDVVGLGKTYMGAMLAKQLEGRTLIIAPPALIAESNPGSWRSVARDFNVNAEVYSIGELEKILEMNLEVFKNVIVDEAHRFRNEDNVTYEMLAQICRGKRIILVTATPFNNRPKDILNQIKLFQSTRKSTIPGTPHLENFFARLEGRLDKLDRKKDYETYIQTTKENAEEIREKVLKYVMVRRTRREIEQFFSKDLRKQNMKFPEVADPIPAYYQLTDSEDAIFTQTISLIAQNFKYARYTAMAYYVGKDLSSFELQQSKNLGRFMKILLIKRLESSFYAFKSSIDRFIDTYESFQHALKSGSVYISKKYITKIFELLDDEDLDTVHKLIEEGKGKEYPTTDFNDQLAKDIESDLQVLKEISGLWKNINHDPKLEEFIRMLRNDSVLGQNKLIVFTESKETANYLYFKLKDETDKEPLLYTGGSSALDRDKVIANFDANAKEAKDDYRILITTEVLSEGVNLHRSNVVINYDIPWNPTRMMQRVGRINRVDTPHDKIYTYNFFPTTQSNDLIKLKESAEAKISSFIQLLGNDAPLLTDEEVVQHKLFDTLISRKTIVGEEDDVMHSELRFLEVIKSVRDEDPDKFNKIKQLPKKARTAVNKQDVGNYLFTFFRRGKLQKFYISSDETQKELGFVEAATLLETEPDIKREKIPSSFYQLLEKNKNAFEQSVMDEVGIQGKRGGADTVTKLIKLLKGLQDLRKLTDEQEAYLMDVTTRLELGDIPKQTAKSALSELEKSPEIITEPLKAIAILQKNIPPKLLESHYAQSSNTSHKREVILSEYFV